MAKSKGKYVFVKTKGRTVKLHPTERFVRERVMEPSECQPGTFRTKKTGKHEIVICKPKGSKTTKVQAILHPESLPKVEKEVKERYSRHDGIRMLKVEAKLMDDDEIEFMARNKNIPQDEREVYIVELAERDGDYASHISEFEAAQKRIRQVKEDKEKLEMEVAKLSIEELLTLKGNRDISPLEMQVYTEALDEKQKIEEMHRKIR